MPRLLALTQSRRYGGDDTVLLELVAASAPGDEWTVGVNRSHPGLPAYEKSLPKGARLEPLELDGDEGVLAAARGVRGLFERVRPDAALVSSGGFPPTPATVGFLLAARLAGVPRVVLVAHNEPAPSSGVRALWRGLRGRLAAALCDEVASVSRDCADKVSAACGRPVRAVLNGSAPAADEPAAALRAELGVPADAFVVGAVGNIEERKGFAVLLEAFRRLAPGERDRLVLVGASAEPEEEARLRAAAEDPALKGRVLLAGYRERAGRFAAAFDVCAVPSLRRESFGLMCLDAMRSGRPVVASRVGGLPEVVADGETGLLVPAGDPEALAAAMRRLRADSGERARLGEAGRRRWSSTFTAERMAARYREMLLCSINEQRGQ